MPPPGGGKKKKGRAPKHQNTFGFVHNPKSKKTDKILASANVGVCKRCYDKLEWRKKYRKYKPRSQPGKCNICFQKNVLAAYHTICAKCTGSDKAFIAMEKHQGGGGTAATATANTTTSTTDESKSVAASESVDKNEEETITTEPSPAPNAVSASNNTKKSIKRRIRVCAVCTNEPAMSKYANASKEDMVIIEQIHQLEDSLELGEHPDDGRKMTLREVRGVERNIDKLHEELKQRRKKDAEDEEDGGEENDADEDENEGSADDSVVDGGRDEPHVESDDPFLQATGGKAMVGEDYRNMLLAREQQK